MPTWTSTPGTGDLGQVGNLELRGPRPWVDVRAYYASASTTETTGSITTGTSTLTVADASSFAVNQGIFVARAGTKTVINNCDSGWVTDGGGNVTVTHDTADKQEGTASVKIVIAAGFATGLAAHVDFGAPVTL